MNKIKAELSVIKDFLAARQEDAIKANGGSVDKLTEFGQGVAATFDYVIGYLSQRIADLHAGADGGVMAELEIPDRAVQAPVPSTGTQDLAEKVARSYCETIDGLDWDAHKGSHYATEARIRAAAQWLVALGAAGLAVVELPEPDGWVDAVGDDGEDATTPYWRTSGGESVTAWTEGVETSPGDLREELDAIRADALKILAAVAACERFRAGRQGGDSR